MEMSSNAAVEVDGGAAKATTIASKSSQQSRNTGGPIRLSSVQGYETRTNDIIYCPPLEKVYIKEGKELQNQAIVYFGGDIQVRLEISFREEREILIWICFSGLSREHASAPRQQGVHQIQPGEHGADVAQQLSNVSYCRY